MDGAVFSLAQAVLFQKASTSRLLAAGTHLTAPVKEETLRTRQQLVGLLSG